MGLSPVCRCGIASTDGHGMAVRLGQEWHSCGIRKHGVEQGELWAGVRETAPGAAREGLLL